MKKVLVVLLTIVMLFATTAVNVFADSYGSGLPDDWDISEVGEYNVSLSDGTFEVMDKLDDWFYQYKGLENTTGKQLIELDGVVNKLYIRNWFMSAVAFCDVVTPEGVTYTLDKYNGLVFENADESYDGDYDLYFADWTRTLYITYPSTAIVLPTGNGVKGWNVFYENEDGSQEVVEAINCKDYILENGRPVTIEVIPEDNYLAYGDSYTFTPGEDEFDSSELQTVEPFYGVQVIRDKNTLLKGKLNEDGLWEVVANLKLGDKFGAYNFGTGKVEAMDLDKDAEHVTPVVCGDVTYFEGDADGTYTITIDPENGTVYVTYVHNHTWKIEADNTKGTFTATCVGDGCTDPVAQLTLTLNVPENAAYNGEEFEASFDEEEAEAWEELVGKVPEIRYFMVLFDEAGGYLPLCDCELPTHAGTYVAVASTGSHCDCVTVTKEFTIAKSEPIAPKVIDSFTYDGKDHQLIKELASCDLVFYSMSGIPGTYIAGPWALESFIGNHAGTYTIYYFGVEGLDHTAITPGKLTVTINPIELTGTWSNLSYVYDGEAHTPDFELEGVLDKDKCHVKPVITMDREAIEQGIYHATVKATICPCGNYVFEPQTALFYIFDHKVANSRITTGTMNLTTNDGIVGIIPTEITMDDFVDKIVASAKPTDPDYDAKQALLAGLEDGKNMHIFTKFIDIEEAAKAMFEKDYKLTDENAVLFDAGLFASLDGEDELYELKNTCDYDVTLTLVLSEDEAKKLVGDNKTYYLLRYADGKVEEIAISAPVKNVDEDGNVTYSFTFKTNKFGSFALASRDKGASPDTGANSPLLPIYAAICVLIAGLYVGLGKKESK